jgi:hypothetical protein
MDGEGNHGRKQGGEGNHESTLSPHTCPPSPYLPSFVEGNHEGEGNHGGNGQTITGEPEGEIVANGYAQDRKPLEPLACRVTIRQIHHPAIKAGPDDDLADFV